MKFVNLFGGKMFLFYYLVGACIIIFAVDMGLAIAILIGNHR